MNAERPRLKLAQSGRELIAASDSINSSHDQRPRLLVSVRSAEEALRAIDGGAEIVDVKEPAKGSLGMATLDCIAQIRDTIAAKAGRLSQVNHANGYSAIPLSVALGESVEWDCSGPIPSLPDGIRFAKLGLSQYKNRNHWWKEWLNVREEFQRRSSSQLTWIAVAYADCDQSKSPGIDQVLSAAIDTGCRGMLVDTFSKEGKNLLDSIDVESLAALAERCHSSGLFIAIAGKLSAESISKLSDVAADVLAIRSAACMGTNRTAEISSSRIAQFLDLMRQNFKLASSDLMPLSYSSR